MKKKKYENNGNRKPTPSNSFDKFKEKIENIIGRELVIFDKALNSGRKNPKVELEVRKLNYEKLLEKINSVLNQMKAKTSQPTIVAIDRMIFERIKGKIGVRTLLLDVGRVFEPEKRESFYKVEMVKNLLKV